MSSLLTEEQIGRELENLPDWSRTDDQPALTATYEFVDFQSALDFVNQVGREAELLNHHPDIDIRWNKVTLVLSTHSAGGLTHLDVELAHRISTEAGHEL
jgi:4a-hydroxytetrahydrobiopterin dehydratase